MASEYVDYRSFSGKARVFLCLLGIIPLLLTVYLFVHEHITLSQTGTLLAAVALFSILIGFTILRRSADRLGRLAQETGKLQENEALDPMLFDADQEMNDIALHFNQLMDRLRKGNQTLKAQQIRLKRATDDLQREKEKTRRERELRNRLSPYVGKNLVDKLMRSEGNITLANERKTVTLLFADIKAFSKITECMDAEEVVTLLNQFFGRMVAILKKHNGALDKFVGDQLMAVFGLVPGVGNPARDAIQAAIEMQSALDQWMAERAAQQLITFRVGIGINTGSAIVGNVGTESRMDYTVIGDCVNLAARLEDLSAGGEIVIGEHTYAQSKGSFKTKKRSEFYFNSGIEQVVCYQILP